MCTSLHSGAHLCLAPKLQETLAL
uniref:Uncharacterized protein n=1 Tax=Rhizophora mucronata TaxID=61149 RepID=A0A2P2J231_RHIMU